MQDLGAALQAANGGQQAQGAQCGHDHDGDHGGGHHHHGGHGGSGGIEGALQSLINDVSGSSSTTSTDASTATSSTSSASATSAISNLEQSASALFSSLGIPSSSDSLSTLLNTVKASLSGNSVVGNIINTQA
jgi:hypothetical protein